MLSQYRRKSGRGKAHGPGFPCPGFGVFVSSKPLQAGAFPRSSNKINLDPKGIGTTSNAVPRLPTTSPGSIHPCDQLDSFKYNNSGFLEPVFQVKSDFQDVSGTLSSEYGFTGPN